jgi:hypothetical protein
MTKDDLQKFCEPGNPRMATPFSFGSYTLATNGHILIRVARLSDIPERADAIPLERVNQHFISPIIQQDHYPLPDFPAPEKHPCKECRGKGKDYTCPECDGDGEIEWDTNYNSYSTECKLCLAERIIHGICPVCNGSGYYYKPESLLIGAQFYDKRYLAMIRDLPDSRFAPGHSTKEPGHFVFTDGDGIVMPRLK